MNRHASRSGAASPSRTVAPFHRGPAAVVAHAPAHSAAPTVAPPSFAPNAALLIDFDNVTMGIRSDLQEELKNLLSSDIIKGKVAVRRAYADWRRYQQYIVPLTEASIDLIFAPAYGSSKKNATDIRLAIDALELVFTRPEIGTFVLLSGDSDFSSMVIKLKEYGKYVIGVGIRESSSDLLVMNCDEYYSYNALAGLVRAGEDETTRWDPWELVTEAVGRMKRNGDVMRSDRLKQVMQDIDASFDEKNLGYPKFSRFVQEAQNRNLLRVSKLESGQLEVDVVEDSANGAADTAAGQTGSASTSAPARPAAELTAQATGNAGTVGEARSEKSDQEREDRRGRRGRRGGRGRGRERDRTAVSDVESSEAPALDGSSTGITSGSAASPMAGTDVGASAIEPSFDRQTDSSPIEPEGIRPLSTDSVGRSGERLTRSEAFDLVRKSVESLTDGSQVTSASAARQKAFELLGRDSESLSERMFERILKDAHDENLIDLRRRGNDWEVARAADAESIVDQLKSAESAAAAEAAGKASVQSQAPRGMSARGIGSRGAGPRGKEIPPELLMVGVVAPVGAGRTAGTIDNKTVASVSVSAASAESPKASGSAAVSAELVVKTEGKGTTRQAAKSGARSSAKSPAKSAAKSATGSAAKSASKSASTTADRKPAGKSAASSERTAGATTKPASKAAQKVVSKSAPKSSGGKPARTAAKSAAKAPAKSASGGPRKQAAKK